MIQGLGNLSGVFRHLIQDFLPIQRLATRHKPNFVCLQVDHRFILLLVKPFLAAFSQDQDEDRDEKAQGNIFIITPNVIDNDCELFA
jgi:hypothetical protein